MYLNSKLNALKYKLKIRSNSDPDLDEATHRSAGLQVRAVQDPFASCHGCQVLFIAQGGPYNDVGAAGVKRLLVQDYTTYNTKQKESQKLKTKKIHIMVPKLELLYSCKPANKFHKIICQIPWTEITKCRYEIHP